MQDLKITLIQTSIYWQDPEANRSMLEEKIWKLTRQTDVIVLPEMFTTGFTMDTTHAEHPRGRTWKWLHQQAAQSGAAITGSIIVKDGEKFRNRLYWVEPDGTEYFYDKKHLFRMAGETNYYAQGDKRLIVTYREWKIALFICYDLRFPVWMRNRYDRDEEALDYDAFIVVANWPGIRIDAWRNLLKARAIENLSFGIGVNRTGIDENEIRYNGYSALVDPRGERLRELKDEEGFLETELNEELIRDYRKKFPAFLDSDFFEFGLNNE